MIIVVTTNEYCEKMRRNRLIASHGVDFYTGQTVILPPESPGDLGAVYDSELREYVIVKPETKDEDKVRAHAGFTESAKTAIALFLPQVKMVGIFNKHSDLKLDIQDFDRHTIVGNNKNSVEFSTYVVRQVFEDGKHLLFAAHSWEQLAREITEYHHESVLRVCKAMLNHKAAIEVSKTIGESVEEVAIRASEDVRSLSFLKGKASAGTKAQWEMALSLSKHSQGNGDLKEIGIFGPGSLGDCVQKALEVDQINKASLPANELMGILRASCGYVENGTSTVVYLCYESKSNCWLNQTSNGYTKRYGAALPNILNQDEGERIFPVEGQESADGFSNVLQWVKDNPGHRLAVFQDDATKSWHIKIYAPVNTQTPSKGVQKALYENTDDGSFKAAWVSLSKELNQPSCTPNP